MIAARIAARIAAAVGLVVGGSAMAISEAVQAQGLADEAGRPSSGSQPSIPVPQSSIPRAADGKPDLSGIWQTLNTAEWDLEPHRARKDAPAGLGVVDGDKLPYQPWALAEKKRKFEHRAAEDPRLECYLPGVPRATYTPLPFQIFQKPGELTVIYEYRNTARTIFTNGSKHPDGHIDWWMGDSRGRWEGDTLVVDVVDFNDRTWFDRAGNFHSDALHVVERYALVDADHIRYEATIEDPKVFTRPWTMSMLLYRHKEENAVLLEYQCHAFDYEKYYP
jgi:hypothetical protein